MHETLQNYEDQGRPRNQKPAAALASNKSGKSSNKATRPNDSNDISFGAARLTDQHALHRHQSGNESGLLLTDAQSHASASLSDEFPTEPQMPKALPPDDDRSMTATNDAASQKAVEATVSRVSRAKPVSGRLDHDIAHMLWCQTQKRMNLLKQSLTRDSRQSHGSNSSSRQLPGAEGNINGAGGSLPTAEGSCHDAERGLHGTEGEVYIADEAAAEQQAAAGSASANPADVALDVRLPDEVLVEQANAWAGR